MDDNKIYRKTYNGLNMNTYNAYLSKIKTKLAPVNFFGAILMFFMIFFPVSYNAPKAIVLAMVLGSVLIEIFSTNIKINQTALRWILLFLSTNMFFIFWGILNSAPGAIRVVIVDILWPIVFFIIGLGIKNRDTFEILSKWMLILANLISLYDISYIVNKLGYIKFPNFLYSLDLDLGFGNYYPGFIEYTTTHMASFMFLVPFTVSLLFLTNKNNKLFSRKLLIPTLLLQLFCVIASGRSALVLVTIISPLIHLFLNYLAKTKKQFILHPFKIMRFILAIVIWVIIVIYIVNKMSWEITTILSNLLAKLNLSNTDANLVTSVRAKQFWALFNGWLESPLIGHGAGSFTKEIIRSNKYVWAYELSYSALLFQKGIVGFGVFWGFIVWICRTVIKKVRTGMIDRTLALPYVVGMIGFLVANGTNPYLGKFGYMWVIYIPFALAQLQSQKTQWRKELIK